MSSIIDLKDYFNDLDVPEGTITCPPGQHLDTATNTCVDNPITEEDKTLRDDYLAEWDTNRATKNLNGIEIAETRFIEKYGENWREDIDLAELKRWNATVKFWGNQPDKFWKFMLYYNMVEPYIWGSIMLGTAAGGTALKGGMNQLYKSRIINMLEKSRMPPSILTPEQAFKEGWAYTKDVTELYGRNLQTAVGNIEMGQYGNVSPELQREISALQKTLGRLPPESTEAKAIINEASHRMAQQMTEVEMKAIKANQIAMYGEFSERTGKQWGKRLPTMLSKPKQRLTQLPIAELEAFQTKAMYKVPSRFKTWIQSKTYGGLRNKLGYSAPDLAGKWTQTPWELEGEEFYKKIIEGQAAAKKATAEKLAQQKYLELLKKSGNMVDDLNITQQEILSEIFRTGKISNQWQPQHIKGLQESMERTGMWNNIDDAIKDIIHNKNYINSMKPAFPPGKVGGPGFSPKPGELQGMPPSGGRAQMVSETIPPGFDDWMYQNFPGRESNIFTPQQQAIRNKLSTIQTQIENAKAGGNLERAKALQSEWDNIFESQIYQQESGLRPYGVGGRTEVEQTKEELRRMINYLEDNFTDDESYRKVAQLSKTLDDLERGAMSRIDDFGYTRGLGPLGEIKGAYQRGGQAISKLAAPFERAIGSTYTKGLGSYLATGGSTAGSGALAGEFAAGFAAQIVPYLIAEAYYSHFSNPENQTAEIGMYNYQPTERLLEASWEQAKPWYEKSGGGKLNNPEALFRGLGALTLGGLQQLVPFTGGSTGMNYAQPIYDKYRNWMIDPVALRNMGLSAEDIENAMPYLQYERARYLQSIDKTNRPPPGMGLRPAWGGTPMAYSGIGPGTWLLYNKAGKEDFPTVGFTGVET